MAASARSLKSAHFALHSAETWSDLSFMQARTEARSLASGQSRATSARHGWEAVLGADWARATGTARQLAERMAAASREAGDMWKAPGR
jgi:hypothetical protein